MSTEPRDPTEPTAETPAPDPAPSPRRLTRASDDRVLGGVAGGLGHYFSVDPIIPRIAFAALVFAGGFGILAYLAAWLLVPDERTGETAASTNRAAAFLGAVVLIAAIAVVSGGEFLLFGGPGLFVLLLAGVLGYAIWKAVSGESGGSVAGRLVLVFVLGLLALAVMAAVTVFAALGGDTLIAALVIAAGLLVALGASSGKLRWLLVPAVLVAVPAGLVAAADLDLSGGVGEREYRPASMADVRDGYELGVGELVVDLRGVDLPAGRTDLDLDLGIGRAVVLIPEDACIAPDVRIGAGDARVLGIDNAGVDVRLVGRPRTSAAVATVGLDAQIGVGELVVARDPSAIDRDFWHDDPFWHESGEERDAIELRDGAPHLGVAAQGQVCDR